MKPPMQILMIALAVIFAVALALTVALICLSYIQEGSAEEYTPNTDEEDSTPVGNFEMPTTDLDTPWEEDTGKKTEAPTEEPTDPPIDTSNGLEYRSNVGGTATLTGIGTCRDACIVIPEYTPDGDRVTEIAPSALYGVGTVTAVQIPASVERIGALAFAGCKNLIFISVSEENRYYCDVDGILYNAAQTELLLYPPMHAGANFNLPKSIKTIHDMAFYNCAYLSRILYAGSPEEWETIAIGSKNYSLTAAAKSFYSTGK